MKIVITAQGMDLDSEVDPRFGRAPQFLVYDLETEVCEAVSNSAARSSGQGAGVQAAQLIAAQGAGALLTGHCGPKAHQLLSASGVKIYTGVEGLVRDAIAHYQLGKLSLSDAPDVDGHWS
jgi:predicted Fe-Mo cluster-binding NifX family protein